MAGLGSAWGSREEFLHPRDRHGRFRKKWQMAQNVIDAISNFLDGFNPRTFQSDGQSSQYLFNRAKPSRFGGGSAYPRLHADYDEANANLRTGNMDESTKKFVKMMDDSAINLDSDLILSRTVGPDAFGLTPEQLGLEDGGIEDFTGRLIADRGYSAANIGTPMSHGPGKITMSIAVPKGTKAIIPARSPNDRGIFLDRDQELRITKVKPDGTGGFYMMAVATPRTPGNTPEPINRGPRGVGLTPQEREARVTGTQHLQAKREGIVSDAKINAGAIEQGTQQVKTEQPAQLPPAQGAPSAPGGPPPRNEPIHAESIGGADTQGKGTAEIAQTKAPETPAAPQAPALPPEAPPAHVPDIRSAVREANIPSPSAGDRRREWNNAFLGVASGKKNPEDMLRELEADIKKNRGIQEEDKTTGRVDPHLADDIKAQDQLADAIAKEFGLQRQVQPPPVKKAAPSKVTPIAQAPGEKHRGIPGEAGTRPVTNLEARRAAKAVQAPRAPQREEPTPPPAKKATPEVAKVIPIKQATGRMTLKEAQQRTAVDALHENKIEGEGDNSYKNILKNVESGEWTPARARQEAKGSAKYFRSNAEDAKGFGRATPEQRQQIQDKNNAIADKYEKLADDLLVSGSVTKTDKYRNAPQAPSVAKKAAAPTPIPETAQLPETTPGSGKVRMSQLREGVPILVEKRADGTWVPATKKTGATRITVKEVNPVTGRGGQRQVVGTDEQGNKVEVQSRANVQTFFLGNAPIKKTGAPTPAAPSAPAVKKAAPPVPSAPGVAKKAAPSGTQAGMADEIGRMARLIDNRPDDPVDARNAPKLKAIATRLQGGPIDHTEQRLLRDQLREIANDYPNSASGANLDGWANALDKFRSRRAVPKFPSKTAPAAKKAAPEVPPGNRIPVRGGGFVDTRTGELHGGPNAPTPEAAAAPDIDKMTKAELIAHASEQGITARQSWTKDKIKQDIRRKQEAAPRPMGVFSDNPAIREAAQAEIARQNKANVPGRGIGSPDHIPANEPNLIADLAKEVGIQGDGGGVIPSRQLDLKQGMSELEVADRIFRDADQLEASPMPAPGTDKSITKAMQAQRDESVANLRELGARLRAHGSPPAEPNAPAAQKAIQAPDRKEAFDQAWTKAGALADLPDSAAGRSIAEVRDDVSSGKLTPDEGIRRLENDIDLNKADLADVDRGLRATSDHAEISRLMGEREKLRAAIKSQEDASSFMRKHFRNAPAVTPKEVEVQLDPEAKKLVDSAGPNDIREAAKLGGFGELKGESKDELLQDLVKKIAGKELASRAAKKAAPKRLAPAPLVTKKSGDPDYVDARSIAEGLDMDESDNRMLNAIQDMLDGKEGRAITPAAAGRTLKNWAEGPSGPAYKSAVIHGLNDKNDRGLSPELQKEDDALQAQLGRWRALSDRLLKTRRRPARKATEPAPEKPKLTTEEKKVTAQAAEVLGVPKEQLQSRALAKKVAAAPPPESAKSAVEQLGKMESREEGTKFLERRTKSELQDILRATGVPVSSRDSKAELTRKIVDINIAGRLQFKALTKGTSFEERRGLTGNVEDMTPAQLADMETLLGIKRASLDRGDRIAAIKAAQAEKSAQASIPKSLPSSGRKWNWAMIEEDNMTMHGDSASMGLAQKLQKAGREDAAQYVADMRFRISNSQGEHDAADVEKMVADLKKMRDAEPDPNLKKAYDRALDDIDAPESAAPKLPASTPEPLKKMMNELNQIPVARRSGHFAGTTKEVSAVDRLAQLIGKVDAGEGGSIGTVESEIRRILRSFHESVDGAFQMWRLENLIDSPDIKAWIRSFY